MIKIFAVLSFTAARTLQYKPQLFEDGLGNKRYLVVCAARPRSEKQAEKLRRFLLPFNGLLVPPAGPPIAALRGMQTYPGTDFENLALMGGFLGYCKAAHPQTVTVCGHPKIKESFYFKLADVAGRICIAGAPHNAALCRSILAYNGTPVLFRTAEEAEMPETVLDLCALPALYKKTSSIPAAQVWNKKSIQFDRRLFDRPEVFNPPAVLPPELQQANPLVLAAASYREWCDSKVLTSLQAALTQTGLELRQKKQAALPLNN